jgi:glycerophosphoryl diester phosphodiesterase
MKSASVALLLLASCSATSPRTAIDLGAAQTHSSLNLPVYFDCLREKNETLVSAHRGGPAPGYPENALETFQTTMARNPNALLEMDVRRARDGTLYLMHDETLERTSSGSGPGAELNWAQLETLRLRDPGGKLTGFAIPKLDAVLDWARTNKVIVQLDVKRGVPFEAVIKAVRAAYAERSVVIITYTDVDALQVARLAPDLMISAGIEAAEFAANLMRGGMTGSSLLAWTGTKQPSPALFAALRAQGVEPMFGTLGKPDESLDDVWLADGNAAEFVDLAASGAVVIGTDRAAEVERVLKPVTCPKP